MADSRDVLVFFSFTGKRPAFVLFYFTSSLKEDVNRDLRRKNCVHCKIVQVEATLVRWQGVVGEYEDNVFLCVSLFSVTSRRIWQINQCQSIVSRRPGLVLEKYIFCRATHAFAAAAQVVNNSWFEADFPPPAHSSAVASFSPSHTHSSLLCCCGGILFSICRCWWNLRASVELFKREDYESSSLARC